MPFRSFLGHSAKESKPRNAAQSGNNHSPRQQQPDNQTTENNMTTSKQQRKPRVIDVGCGPGIYVSALQARGVDAIGVDIDPWTPCIVADIFSAEFKLEYYGLFTLALCLEVAEHLPASKADALVECLTNLAPVVLFSAAIPGQGGHGHINCQPKEYWVAKFNEKNFVVDHEATEDILGFIKQGPHMGWFPQNAMVLKQYGAACYDRISREETPQAERLAQYIATSTLLK